MKLWMKKQSLFTKTILILGVTMGITFVVSIGFLRGAVTQVVRRQINQSTKDTLQMASLQLEDKILRGTSVLVTLRTNEEIQTGLMKEPKKDFERDVIRNNIQKVINNAYYAIESEMKVAIVTRQNFVYANYSMYNQKSLVELAIKSEEYYEQQGFFSSGLYSCLYEGISLFDNGKKANVFVQAMPLLDATKQEYLGMAMVLFPESLFYDSIVFEDSKNHTTYLVNEEGTIISAKAKDVLNQNLEQVLKQDNVENQFITSSKDSYRMKIKVVDVMSKHYIGNQVELLLSRMAVYLLLTMGILMVVSYFMVRGITRPLIKLTQKMVKNDYGSYVDTNSADLGKNEILLLQNGFEVMQKNIEQLIKNNEQKERQKREVEITALQAQIRPHFLFNTLNTIRCSILNNHTEKAANMIIKLTMLLRMSLRKGKELVPLTMELEGVQYYIDIMRMRHAIPFSYETDIAEDTMEFQLPKLLLQPMVENCIIHGFSVSVKEPFIKIISRSKEGFWYLEIINNGSKLEQEINLMEKKLTDSDEFSGIGIENVNKRLKLHFGEESGLRIYPDASGNTVATLKMKLG